MEYLSESMALQKLVSVVITTKNEAKNIAALLDSLLGQSLAPKEIIIVDADSSDDTPKIIKKYQHIYPKIQLYSIKGNRSAGRNLGIKYAKCEYIAITDAGCIADPEWLKQLVRSVQEADVAVVAGFYRGVGVNLFEQALIPYVLVMPDKANDQFLATTRSMLIKKSVWANTGGFNEQIDPSEDYEYSLRLKKSGYKSVFNPDAIVYWRPNRGFKQAVKMFYKFAYSDSMNNLPRPKVKYIFARYFVGVIIGILFPSVAVVGLIFYAIWSINKSVAYLKNPQAMIWLPFIQIASDLAVMTGTFLGQTRKISREYAK